MGNTDSTQKLGERVIIAKRKLQQNQEIQSERYDYLRVNCPAILADTMESIKASFKSYSPYLEATLLLAWMHDSETCKKIVLDSCRKVLSAPVNKTEFAWFKNNVFESSLWFFKTKDNKYMYQELLNIAKDMSSDIIDSMNSIYQHLETHNQWKQITDIKERSDVPRQDNPKVGLFKNTGFQDLFDSKTDDEKSHDMKSFVDSNLAINILTSTATNINKEFQNHVKTVMGHYGEFQPGPIKKTERCVSKLENDYQNEQFPKSAKLLDLIRCSVTFNTVNQLLKGYNALIKHISKHQNVIELARIKNGFLDKNHSGYRDIKLNVIYKSVINPGSNMICEIQLLLGQYLHEKKRIHKLYSIVREELYFEMVTKEAETETKTKDIKDLKFVPVLNFKQHVETNYSGDCFFKCTIDSELDLLALEGKKWFGCVDMKQRKIIFDQNTTVGGKQTHCWFRKNKQKYLSLETAPNTIKIFEVNQGCKFKEDESLRITLQDEDKINYCEFDTNFDNILIVYNKSILQKRAMNNVNKILVDIKLNQRLMGMVLKQLSISGDGKICAIASGYGNPYFYLIDIPNNKQQKVTLSELKHTYVPCFINRETEYVSIGSRNKFGIWNIAKQSCFKQISVDGTGCITCAVSTNNILGIGSEDDKTLRLFDVRSWELFYSQKYDIIPYSLHLTEDLKYLTIGGNGGNKCSVLQIQSDD